MFRNVSATWLATESCFFVRRDQKNPRTDNADVSQSMSKSKTRVDLILLFILVGVARQDQPPEPEDQDDRSSLVATRRHKSCDRRRPDDCNHFVPFSTDQTTPLVFDGRGIRYFVYYW